MTRPEAGISATGQVGNNRDESGHDPGELCIRNPGRRIAAGVVVIITVQGGIRYHNRLLKTLLPERPVIRPAYTGQQVRGGNTLDRKRGMTLKGGLDPLYQAPPPCIAYQADKIGSIRIEHA